jgi:diguanylate cyclase (GGDEF)-like protein
VLTALTPLLALALVFVTSARTDLEGVARENLANQARLQATAVDNVLKNAREAVGVLAANPILRDQDADPEQIRQQLDAYGQFDEIVLLHPAGVVIEATSYRFSGRWDANAAFRGAMAGQQVMTPPVFYADPDRLVVHHAAPVVRDGDVVAVVVGTMNMDRVWRALDGITIGRSGYFAAFDQHGNVIAHPDKSLVLRKLEGFPSSSDGSSETPIRYVQPDGAAQVGHSVTVPSSGWRVAALEPEDEAYAIADTAVSRAWLVAIVTLLIALGTVLVVSSAVSKPMETVNRAMRRIADGHLEQRVRPAGLDEIDRLTDSFNAMAAELEERSTLLDAEMAERDRAEQRIRYQAYHDPLTGLPNRMLLKDRLDLAQADARRSGQALALMFLDLDRFKLVNDSMGHTFGDELLLSVADRITSVLREGDSVARVGGDEYVLLLPRVSGAEEALAAAHRVVESLRVPWEVDGREFHLTASIGIALYPGDGVDAESLMRNADTAMYQAKEEGRDRIRVFRAEMDQSVQHRVRLEQDLRRALQLEQFVLHYQPQVQSDTGRVTGMEALLRWDCPKRGLVPPDRFISLAEETGLIWELGRWVLRTACAQVQAWTASGQIESLSVSVNVSARQFHDMGIVDEVQGALAETGLCPGQLELEITESTAMRDVEHSIRTLTRLKEMGVRVSIDDFGTGYSSLSYLKRFPVDAVKIDRSFVMDISRDPDDAAIVAAIIALAGSLKMQTVAEGVETDEQLAFLQAHGCPSFQGFLFSKALPPAEFVRLLADDAVRGSEPRDTTMPARRRQLALSQ